MRRYRTAALALMLACGPVLAADSAQTIATRLLDQLDAGNYPAAEAMLSPEMKAAVPADKLKTVWESLPAQMGAAAGRGPSQVKDADGMGLVTIPLEYANGRLQAQIAVDGRAQIAGFLIQPAAASAAPAPAADAGFREQAFAVPVGSSGKISLPGTLALPDGEGPFPVVVLVHGSGPQDRDETIGPNRPFLDIARGLAARGIAVVRYDKRTQARPQDFAGGGFSIDDETTDDAVSAVATVSRLARIDPKQVYVLGHSQGGLLAARIANASNGGVAGLILLAAPARPILDLLAEQNRHLVGLDGSISSEEQAHLDALDASIATLRRDPDATLMGLPGSFWQQLEKIEPVSETRATGLPVLLLQGGRDFQVIDIDWQLWKQGLQGERYTFHHYPALNHLGIAGEGPGRLEEYATPGKVDPQLIGDVARWIKAQHR